MIAPLEVFGAALNDDQWDGYDYERNRLYDSIINNTVNNIVVLTGDIHTSWVNDIPLSNYDASNCTGSIGVEYVVTSVTSPGLGFLGGIAGSTIELFNSHIQYTNLSEHGYLILDVSKSKVTGNYYYVNDIDAVLTGEYFDEAYFVLNGENVLSKQLDPLKVVKHLLFLLPISPLMEQQQLMNILRHSQYLVLILIRSAKI